MSGAYDNVRVGKLKLKGAGKFGTSGSDARERQKKRKKATVVVDEDAIRHGGWWKVEEFSQITGPVAIELFPFSYIKALDDGSFTLGAPHPEGEGPNPEEILIAVRVSDTKIALKSGYDKYLAVSASGKLVGKAEAIGSLEQWEPVFEKGEMALAASNQRFLTCKNETEIMASSDTVGMDEKVKIRSNAQRSEKTTDEEDTDASQVELHYVKQFQCFQDKKIKLNPGAVADLETAKKEGNVHETMLDRREKMKSDRMCK
ncbi:protein FRG1 homolog [Paramacrobiotus metropolitanus]|uniref:protein FRG1 homolog n=1 Tax=Paramacrobiotus metropolitanus TaxID=2943436 RepID=UPI002445D47D|nr:protein FRG1 homolog [Paramacrobiotus metropolitanus]